MEQDFKRGMLARIDKENRKTFFQKCLAAIDNPWIMGYGAIAIGAIGLAAQLLFS